MRFAIVLVFCMSLSACQAAAPRADVDQQATSPSSAQHPVRPASTLRPIAPTAPPDHQRVAESFVDFARGGSPEGVPFAPRVDLLLGNGHQRTIPDAETGDRAAWSLCPPEGYYAARSCPFSAIDVFHRSYADRIVTTPTPPVHPCASTVPLPSAYGALEFMTLTPDDQLSCADYFAVQLFVEGGRITAVNLVWAEP